MQIEELGKWAAYKIDKVFNGTVEHGEGVTERKMKVLTRNGEELKQFFFCVKCFPKGLGAFYNSRTINKDTRPKMKY
jgi:aspartyl/asparaginyl-tRNA synthetase